MADRDSTVIVLVLIVGAALCAGNDGYKPNFTDYIPKISSSEGLNRNGYGYPTGFVRNTYTANPACPGCGGFTSDEVVPRPVPEGRRPSGINDIRVRQPTFDDSSFYKQSAFIPHAYPLPNIKDSVVSNGGLNLLNSKEHGEPSFGSDSPAYKRGFAWLDLAPRGYGILALSGVRPTTFKQRLINPRQLQLENPHLSNTYVYLLPAYRDKGTNAKDGLHRTSADTQGGTPGHPMPTDFVEKLSQLNTGPTRFELYPLNDASEDDPPQRRKGQLNVRDEADVPVTPNEDRNRPLHQRAGEAPFLSKIRYAHYKQGAGGAAPMYGFLNQHQYHDAAALARTSKSKNQQQYQWADNPVIIFQVINQPQDQGAGDQSRISEAKTQQYRRADEPVVIIAEAEHEQYQRPSEPVRIFEARIQLQHQGADGPDTTSEAHNQPQYRGTTDPSGNNEEKQEKNYLEASDLRGQSSRLGSIIFPQRGHSQNDTGNAVNFEDLNLFKRNTSSVTFGQQDDKDTHQSNRGPLGGRKDNVVKYSLYKRKNTTTPAETATLTELVRFPSAKVVHKEDTTPPTRPTHYESPIRSILSEVTSPTTPDMTTNTTTTTTTPSDYEVEYYYKTVTLQGE